MSAELRQSLRPVVVALSAGMFLFEISMRNPHCELAPIKGLIQNFCFATAPFIGALVFSLILAIICELAIDVILNVLQTPKEIFGIARSFLRIHMLLKKFLQKLSPQWFSKVCPLLAPLLSRL